MKPKKLYSELKDIIEKLDYKLILDNGNFDSGYCLLEDERIIVVNKNKPYESRVRLLCEILASINLDDIYIKPILRELILHSG